MKIQSFLQEQTFFYITRTVFYILPNQADDTIMKVVF